MHAPARLRARVCTLSSRVETESGSEDGRQGRFHPGVTGVGGRTGEIRLGDGPTPLLRPGLSTVPGMRGHTQQHGCTALPVRWYI